MPALLIYELVEWSLKKTIQYYCTHGCAVWTGQHWNRAHWVFVQEAQRGCKRGIQPAPTAAVFSAGLHGSAPRGPGTTTQREKFQCWSMGLWSMMGHWLHVHIELHLVIKDLYKLLHGREVARLQLRPHWDIIQSDFKSPSGHTLVLNHVAQEEDHHAGVHLVFLSPLPDAWSLHAKESKWVLANDD